MVGIPAVARLASRCVPSRPGRLGVALAGLALITGGCVHPDLDAGVLTPDTNHPDDYYVIDLDEQSGVITTAAPATNTGGNLRMAFWRRADPASLDQQSCATWAERDPSSIQQQGAALRIRRDGGRTRAITITQNIWAGARWVFNVHVMDSAPPGGGGATFTFVDSAEVSLPPDDTPLALCARVIGDQVDFLVWPAGAARPAWGTPGAGGSATLPAGWAEPGIPGLYIGHLVSGERVGFADLQTTSSP